MTEKDEKEIKAEIKLLVKEEIESKFEKFNEQINETLQNNQRQFSETLKSINENLAGINITIKETLKDYIEKNNLLCKEIRRQEFEDNICGEYRKERFKNHVDGLIKSHNKSKEFAEETGIAYRDYLGQNGMKIFGKFSMESIVKLFIIGAVLYIVLLLSTVIKNQSSIMNLPNKVIESVNP